jgi:hypothetical protein
MIRDVPSMPRRQQMQTGSNDRHNKHVSLLEFGFELSDSQPEKDRKKGACIFCSIETTKRFRPAKHSKSCMHIYMTNKIVQKTDARKG